MTPPSLSSPSTPRWHPPWCLRRYACMHGRGANMVCCHGQAQHSTLPHARIHQHQRHAGCFINSRVYYAYCPCVCPTLACAGVLPLSLRQDPGGASHGTAARWRRYRQQPQQRASSSTCGSSRVRPWPLCVQRQRQRQQFQPLLTSCSPVLSADPHTAYRLPR